LRRRERQSLLQNELGPAPRHEYARFNGNPQAAELRPAEDLLQWKSAHPLLHHLIEFVRGCRRRQQ
jgi:hypothetical protein